MRYIRNAVFVILAVTAVACSDVTGPTSHQDCSGGSAEWTKCMR